MANNVNTVGKTFAVVTALCLVCSIFVAGAAGALHPVQARAKATDMQKNILEVAGISVDSGSSVADSFKKNIKTQIIDLSTGKPVDLAAEKALDKKACVTGDADSFDFKSAAKNPNCTYEVKAENDVAGIRLRSKYMPVYTSKDSVILPFYGQGLWSTMYGYLAVAPDGNTVKGIIYYDQGETAGLGGEVTNPKWRAQWDGRKVYADDGTMKLKVTKYGKAQDKDFDVDGISGATLTSRGVDNQIKYWLGSDGYQKYLSSLKEGSK